MKITILLSDLIEFSEQESNVKIEYYVELFLFLNFLILNDLQKNWLIIINISSMR